MPYARISGSVVAYADEHTNKVIVFSETNGGKDQIECPLATMEAQGSVRCLALTPDEELLISGGERGELKVWRTRDQTIVRDLTGHTEAIMDVDVSCDGKSVLSASRDKTLKVWDIESGKCKTTLKGHKNPVDSGVLSRDGKKALSGSVDGTVKVWDIEREECKVTLEGHLDWVCDVQFSPDEKKALSGSADKTVKLWNIERKECEKTFEGHEEWVFSVRFSLDGKTILSASGDKTIKLWSSESGACTKTLTGHLRGVVSAVYTSDESHVVSCGDDGVRVWNVHSGECVRTFEDRSVYFRRVCVSRDGKTIFHGSTNSTLKARSIAKGTQITTLNANHSSIAMIQMSSDGETLLVHSKDGHSTQWAIRDVLPAVAYNLAFSAALARGSVVSRSIKVLFLGATEAGKTALLAALRGEELPGEEDRSLATRMHKMRMVFNKGTGVFEAVSLDELRLSSVLADGAGEKKEKEMPTVVVGDTSEKDEDAPGPSGAPTSRPSSPTPAPAPIRHTAPSPSSGPSSSTSGDRAPSPPPTAPLPPAATTTNPVMALVRGLLEGELREEHVDMDAFDFAGESMYDSLPALFMGSESVYVLVFDLSVMDFERKALRQYEHLSKWAHIIAHQVPTTDQSYFRVIIVGTHLDTFPNNTVPDDLLSRVAREVLRLVHTVLGSHLLMPADTPGVPFFQVGSRKRLGLSAVSMAMHKAVRKRTLPLELVVAQDLIGRWARLGKVDLMLSVGALNTLKLNDEPLVTLGEMLPTESAIREGLVPYLESAADILVCRADATSQVVSELDTIVFDVPRLIGALELLCSVVMARWGHAKSKRALAMLREVEKAGWSHPDEGAADRTARLLGELDRCKDASECGFPVEAAEWLVWTAASTRASQLMVAPSEATPKEPTLFEKFIGVPPPQPELIPLLAGADVTDVSAFMLCLERLSLVLRRDKHLFVPMLLPDHAPFLDTPAHFPVQLFLYQFASTSEMLPVSLATFHLLMVSLWRASLLDNPICATQRCTSAMRLDGCVPVRLRLNATESFVRMELTDDSDPERVQRTVNRICGAVCDGTRSLRWGWRGTPVVVPAHPFESNAPLFAPESVAHASERHRQSDFVRGEMSKHSCSVRVCNERLEEWWVCTQRKNVVLPANYSYAGALVVGVSKYKSTKRKPLKKYADLPGVAHSVTLVSDMWKQRKFSVRSVSDVDPAGGWVEVTEERIEEAAFDLAEEADLLGRTSVLVVHLIGHGVSDGRGGLVLSNAFETPDKKRSCFNLTNLRGILEGHVSWNGCNVLVICDFCNSGALVKDDIGPQLDAPRVGYARQVLASSLPDDKGYTTDDKSQTKLTALLVRALGPKAEVFEAGEPVISVRDLRSRLQSLASTAADQLQALLVGRIWPDWHDTPNDGDILLYRTGSGVVPAPATAAGPATATAPAAATVSSPAPSP